MNNQKNAISITYINPIDNKSYMFQGSIIDLTYNTTIYQLSVAVHPNDKIYPNGLSHPKFTDDSRHFHVFPDENIIHTVPLSELNIDCFEIKMYFQIIAIAIAPTSVSVSVSSA